MRFCPELSLLVLHFHKALMINVFLLFQYFALDSLNDC